MRRAAKKGVIYALMRYEHPNLRWHRHYTNHWVSGGVDLHRMTALEAYVVAKLSTYAA